MKKIIPILILSFVIFYHVDRSLYTNGRNYDNEFDRKWYDKELAVEVCSDIHCVDSWTAKKHPASMMDLMIWLRHLGKIYKPTLFFIKNSNTKPYENN